MLVAPNVQVVVLVFETRETGTLVSGLTNWCRNLLVWWLNGEWLIVPVA
jgi:hypothetical protein